MKARTAGPAVAVVLSEGLLGRLANSMVSFALPLYAYDLGLPLAAVGALVSIRTIAELPLKPFSGWLADRIGLRPLYLLAGVARVLASAALLVAGDFAALAAVRVVQGVSSAGRDVGSLGIIARDAEASVASVFGWYATAKRVGSIAGTAVAGLLIAAAGGSYRPVFAAVVLLSLAPVAATWLWLPSDPAGQVQVSAREDEPRISFRRLAGPASVGMLVASSAYMVQGIFPILATEYAGLTEAEAGSIYALSAGVVVLGAPTFGSLIDRGRRTVAIAWRSLANIGSSLLYLGSPTMPGLAAARLIDDSGKAAFQPAWASAAADLAAADPRRRGRALGAMDTAQTAGEAIGPLLAGALWQWGGVVALFVVRILIAAIAELAALRVFRELKTKSGWRREHVSERQP